MRRQIGQQCLRSGVGVAQQDQLWQWYFQRGSPGLGKGECLLPQHLDPGRHDRHAEGDHTANRKQGCGNQHQLPPAHVVVAPGRFNPCQQVSDHGSAPISIIRRWPIPCKPPFPCGSCPPSSFSCSLSVFTVLSSRSFPLYCPFLHFQLNYLSSMMKPGSSGVATASRVLCGED